MVVVGADGDSGDVFVQFDKCLDDTCNYYVEVFVDGLSIGQYYINPTQTKVLVPVTLNEQHAYFRDGTFLFIVWMDFLVFIFIIYLIIIIIIIIILLPLPPPPPLLISQPPSILKSKKMNMCMWYNS